MMGLPKGMTNNPRGRKRGVPNKVTGDIRAMLQAAFSKYIKQDLPQDLEQMKPSERVDAMAKLLKFVMPQLQATTITPDFESMSEKEVAILFTKIVQ